MGRGLRPDRPGARLWERATAASCRSHRPLCAGGVSTEPAGSGRAGVVGARGGLLRCARCAATTAAARRPDLAAPQRWPCACACLVGAASHLRCMSACRSVDDPGRPERLQQVTPSSAAWHGGMGALQNGRPGGRRITPSIGHAWASRGAPGTHAACGCWQTAGPAQGPATLRRGRRAGAVRSGRAGECRPQGCCGVWYKRLPKGWPEGPFAAEVPARHLLNPPATRRRHARATVRDGKAGGGWKQGCASGGRGGCGSHSMTAGCELHGLGQGAPGRKRLLLRGSRLTGTSWGLVCVGPARRLCKARRAEGPA